MSVRPSAADLAESDYGPGFGAAPEPVTRYLTAGGIDVTRTTTPFDPVLLSEVTRQADDRRGGIFSSGMEYPGRYSRWHIGYVDPCLEVTARGREVTVTALSERGTVLLPAVAAALAAAGEPASPGADGAGPRHAVTVRVPEPRGALAEEQRSRRPTVFSAIRQLINLFAGPDEHLGLFGAFGYDLAFQFEPVVPRRERDPGQRDLVLHLPDEIYAIDRKRETALRHSYEFAVGGRSTAGLDRRTPPTGPGGGAGESVAREHTGTDPVPGAYAAVVERARQRFAAGDLFEVVPSQEFTAPCGSPAEFYERLRRRNPAPYEFFLNLGQDEFLVGASPEMYVRVTGDRVETCPIAGTIARGADPLEDAANIATLLGSPKEESELTMCTDVDRNDKSRICVPGTVQVIGRRQIEMYSRLIHTVDHVEGRLRPEFDALDAFLTHMWAVTVTGAPKAWAMQFIEDHEDSQRRWYGGAVGVLGFDGSMNTGLTLRTAHIRNSVATVRTGATLLFDSDPASEEAETRLKARALIEVLRGEPGRPGPDAGQPGPKESRAGGAGRSGTAPASSQRPPRVLLVDHEDSFVHTLASYIAQAGADVTTHRAGRSGLDPALIDDCDPDLVVLSPGPGRPEDFRCSDLLDEVAARGLPAFGVCLGLQAMVEHAGGRLSLLDVPAHGKPGTVRVLGGELLAGLPAEFTAGRYHSIYALPQDVGARYEVIATTPDGVVMAIEDRERGWSAVQFHPESILTAAGEAGRQVIANLLAASRARMGAGR